MVESKLHDEMIPCFLVPVPGVCSLICLGSLSRVVVGLVGLLTPLYHACWYSHTHIHSWIFSHSLTLTLTYDSPLFLSHSPQLNPSVNLLCTMHLPSVSCISLLYHAYRPVKCIPLPSSSPCMPTLLYIIFCLFYFLCTQHTIFLFSSLL